VRCVIPQGAASGIQIESMFRHGIIAVTAHRNRIDSIRLFATVYNKTGGFY
jgi:hypothetical protein